MNKQSYEFSNKDVAELIHELYEEKLKVSNLKSQLDFEVQRREVAEENASKYKQALEEIREIIKNFSKEDIITLPDLPKEKNYKIIAEQYAKPIRDIIDKINEVLG